MDKKKRFMYMRTLAGKYGISRGEIERMRPAFQECDSAKG